MKRRKEKSQNKQKRVYFQLDESSEKMTGFSAKQWDRRCTLILMEWPVLRVPKEDSYCEWLYFHLIGAGA
jgi:hypothetical protein